MPSSSTKVVLDLFRGFKIGAQPLNLDLAFRELTTLIAKARFQFLGPAAEDFRFGLLCRQLMFKLRGAGCEFAELAAGFVRLMGGRLGFGSFARKTLLS